MKITDAIFLDAAQKEAIYRLWNNEYPSQLGYSALAELDVYLENLKDPHHYFAVNEADDIVGWAFSFEREGERWFAIIVDSTLHRSGVGTMLLNKLKANSTVLNGWVTDHDKYVKANGSPYPSPMGFYLKNSFVVCEGVRLEFEKLSAAKICWTAYV